MATVHIAISTVSSYAYYAKWQGALLNLSGTVLFGIYKYSYGFGPRAVLQGTEAGV